MLSQGLVLLALLSHTADVLHEFAAHVILVTSAGTLESGPYPQAECIDASVVFGANVALGDSRVPCIALDQAGERAIYAVNDSEVWHLRTTTNERTLLVQMDSPVSALDLTTDGKQLVLLTPKGVHFWLCSDGPTPRLIDHRSVALFEASSTRPLLATWNAGGTAVAITTWGRTCVVTPSHTGIAARDVLNGWAAYSGNRLIGIRKGGKAEHEWNLGEVMDDGRFVPVAADPFVPALWHREDVCCYSVRADGLIDVAIGFQMDVFKRVTRWHYLVDLSSGAHCYLSKHNHLRIIDVNSAPAVMQRLRRCIFH